jgi:HlyD family secretion protein
MMDQPTPPTEGDLDEFLGAQPESRQMVWLKRIAIVAIVIVAALLLWRCVRGPSNEVAYATQPVERGDLTVSVSATGNLAPTNQVDVGSELSGLITEVNVDNNDRVTKGQVLARLDTSRLQDTLNQSKAALASAVAQVAQAQATAQQDKANLARLEEVFRISGGKVPSRTELDTGRADYARAVAGVRTAEAQVTQAQAQVSSDSTQFSKALIKSPVNGVVLSRQIEPGQTVAASFNAPVLFTIAEDLARMRLEVKVDEADVGQVKAGQRATFTVDAFPGRTFPATIERVDVGANASGSATSTSSTGTASSSSASASTVIAYTARLTVDNSALLLRPGMTATADIITTEKQNVLLVPNAALRFSPDRGGAAKSGGVTSVLVPARPRRGNQAQRQVGIGRGSRQTVYVLDADGKPKAMQVTAGDSNGSQTEVTGDGLTPGMNVITGKLVAGAERTTTTRRSGSGRRQGQGQGGGQAGGPGGGGQGGN